MRPKKVSVIDKFFKKIICRYMSFYASVFSSLSFEYRHSCLLRYGTLDFLTLKNNEIFTKNIVNETINY